MTNEIKYSLFDKICLSFDQALRACNGKVTTTDAVHPAAHTAEEELSTAERKKSAALMRVNHAGEVCAQALYHGQALVSKNSALVASLNHAALEEGNHLAWCSDRIHELGSYTSYLNPLWYGGSFCIGALAGLAGDQWSLGFVAETETQVVAHLQGHLQRLPKNDARSYVIVQQMAKDEAEHRKDAIVAGAHELPGLIKKAMSITAKIMVKTSYWV